MSNKYFYKAIHCIVITALEEPLVKSWIILFKTLFLDKRVLSSAANVSMLAFENLVC